MKTVFMLLTLLLGSGFAFAQNVSTVMLKGKPVALEGTTVNVGDDAPAVTVISSDLKEVVVGGKQKKTQVLLVVPSIDTPVCDTEARTFNEKASELPDVDIVVISMDLPFASQRYCAAKGIKHLTITSDFQDKTFGKTYGTLIGEGVLKGLEARIIFIVKEGKVTYKQVVPEITHEPDYEAALKAL